MLYHDHFSLRLANPKAFLQELYFLFVRSYFMYGRQQKNKIYRCIFYRYGAGRYLLCIGIYGTYLTRPFYSWLCVLPRIIKIKYLQISLRKPVVYNKTGFIETRVYINDLFYLFRIR